MEAFELFLEDEGMSMSSQMLVALMRRFTKSYYSSDQVPYRVFID